VGIGFAVTRQRSRPRAVRRSIPVAPNRVFLWLVSSSVLLPKGPDSKVCPLTLSSESYLPFRASVGVPKRTPKQPNGPPGNAPVAGRKVRGEVEGR
jgi:hypothetical protein